MKYAGLYEAVASKLVLGENISQTAQFVQTGNADVGLIAMSIAVSPGMKAVGRYAEVPPGTYKPIRQAAIIIRNSSHMEQASKFLGFIRSPEARRAFSEAGFAIPSSPVTNR